MRKSFIFLLYLCFYYSLVNPCFAEVTILTGKIVLNTRGGQPVQGVQVTATGASPTMSNTFGQFELKFHEKKPGSKVALEVIKAGFEVVNRIAKEVVLRAEPDEIVEIIICKVGERDIYAVSYYQIIAEQSIIKKYEKDLEKLKKDLTRAKEKEEETHRRDARNLSDCPTDSTHFCDCR